MKPLLVNTAGAERRRLRLGLLINPLAGLGGAVGLKGSDGVAEQALALGAELRAERRSEQVLAALKPWQDHISLFTAGADMGQRAAEAQGFSPESVYQPPSPSTAQDTAAAARALVAAGIDLLLFAGGDGTARDICAAIGLSVPVLGIPAGVKMHSGVFAVNPQGAAALLILLLKGELVTVDLAEVRDIDEAAARQGRVKTRHYGELKVPAEGRYLQQVKCSGREVEELAVQEIAAEVLEHMQPGVSYVIGPGSTTAAIMTALKLPKTLIGFDAVRDGALIGQDLGARDIEALLAEGPLRAIITATPGQGHLLGRGNQQLSPAVLRALGRDGLWVVASHSKLKELAGRPLLVDTGEPELDMALSGWIEVVTGYQHRTLYRVATHA